MLDTGQAVRFLRLLDTTSPEFSFQTFREKGDDNPKIRPQIIHSKSLVELRRAHETGAGVYVVVNETNGTGRKTENIRRIRAVWQEDDNGYDGQFPLAPSMVIETSPGHFHRYWLVADNWPADEQGRADFAHVMERMVETYGSDKNAKDISRVMRVPGFLHRKADKGPVTPFMVRIVEASGKRYSRAEILAAFPPVPRERIKPREWTPHDDDQRIRAALDHINADDRDIWLQCGMALKDEMGEAGRPIWDAWSQRSNKFNGRDQEKTWRSLRRHGIGIGTLFHHAKQAGWEPRPSITERTNDNRQDAGAAGEHWRDGIISARELCTMRFAPLKFIVPKIIPEGLTILAGRPKIGKSWLVLLLGTVLANGVTALGLDYGTTTPLKGSVLYLGLEDGKRRLQRRMTKLVGIRPENWPEQLYLKTDWRRFDQGGLDDIRAWHSAAKAKGETPVLVVVDTLAKVRAPGSSKSSPYQNDHDALAGLQRLAEELGIAVVVNHHDRKMDAEDIFYTVSGTLGLTGAVDTILVLAKKARRARRYIFAAETLRTKRHWPCASTRRRAGGRC